ncbi:LysE family translocator [Roseobacter sp. HKCCA0434]|uniref:LysE family translocator n=1 Tax=Roseobacter sp. HKCCA0434 TaxID=3079297 RepID=UPI0029059215|nr:LysE family translocator [Roseobacter sp. HKCCA0434]
MTPADYTFVLGAAFVAAATPGPATLAISGTAMQRGRAHGVALAAGVLTGGVMWSSAAALGLAGLMAANPALVGWLRILAALYLGWLAWKSAKSALRRGNPPVRASDARALKGSYLRGLALHLTNPKAIFFFGALYTVGLPVGTSGPELVSVVVLMASLSATIFFGYALLFSTPRAQAVYLRARRWIEGAVAILFAGAALRILRTGSAGL